MKRNFENTYCGLFDSRTKRGTAPRTEDRRVDCFEIEIFSEEVGVSHIDGKAYPVKRGMILCAKPGQIRHSKLPYKCYYIHMILNEGELYDTLMEIPSFIPTNNYFEYLEIFKLMCKYQDSDDELSNIILQSQILKLVYILHKDSEKLKHSQEFKSIEYNMIEKSIKYINDNLSEDLSLETVSKYSSYSPIYFHNCFKKITGKTLHEYVEDLRIKKSMSLLTTTSMTLVEIASQCGFSSQAYFNYVFKKRMNKTPREYAREEYKRYII